MSIESLRCIRRHNITNNNFQLPGYTFVVSACIMCTLYAVHMMAFSATSVALLWCFVSELLCEIVIAAHFRVCTPHQTFFGGYK